VSALLLLGEIVQIVIGLAIYEVLVRAHPRRSRLRSRPYDRERHER
jgi:hypothetical protein